MPPGGPRSRAMQAPPEDLKNAGKRLIKDFKGHYFLLSFIICLAIASAVISLFSPILINNLLSDETLSAMFITTGATLEIDWVIFIQKFSIILIIYILSALFSWLAEFLAISVTIDYTRNLRQQVQRKLDTLPLSYFDRVPYGDTLSIAINDVDNIARNLTTIITQIFTSVTLFVGSLVAMFVVKWELALVAIASLPFTIIVVIIIGSKSGKKFEAYRKQLGELNGQIEEDYAGYKIIKLFNKEKDMISEFGVTNEKMRKSDLSSQFLSGVVFPLTNVINNLAYVAIAVTAGLLNDVAGMITFFLFLNCFTRPFQQLGQIFATIQSVLASGERIFKLLDEQQIIPDQEGAIDTEDNIKGKFKFDNVYFQYSPLKPLIEKFSLEINAGDMVAIVGPTGAGKTTMVNLIMRFYEISHIRDIEDLKNKTFGVISSISDLLKCENIKKEDIKFSSPNVSLKQAINEATTLINNFYLTNVKKADKSLLKDEKVKKNLDTTMSMLPNIFNTGDIYLDGTSLEGYKRDVLRASVGMVLQDTWLFKGTIKENLLFGDQNATDEEIKKACVEAHIDHFIETLPGKYDFVLSEDGTNVSQGQRQLLTIARAIISKPKIMILDEATSSVDTRTEQRIQDALNTIMKGKTSFVIAHRLSTIKNAKLIIVMQKGHIVEVGSHKELLEKKGFYADLYNSQFLGVNPMAKNDDALES